MNKMQDQIRTFHRDVLKQPHSPAEPKMRNPTLRARLILEEAIETVVGLVGTREAFDMVEAATHELAIDCAETPAEPDLVEVIDGLCDTIVVCLGTAEDIGIDLEPFYDEVHRSNMAKVGGPINEHGKQLKPPGWTPPDIEGVLDTAIIDWLEAKAKSAIFTDDIHCIDGMGGHATCRVVVSGVVCKCDCRDCKRRWFAAGEPVERDGKIVKR